MGLTLFYVNKELPKRVLDHARNYSVQNRTTHLEARVGVYLNQPWLEIRVNHEIETKNLKVVTFSRWVNEAKTRFDRIGGYLFEFRVNLALEIVILFIVFGQTVQISLQL